MTAKTNTPAVKLDKRPRNKEIIKSLEETVLKSQEEIKDLKKKVKSEASMKEKARKDLKENKEKLSKEERENKALQLSFDNSIIRHSRLTFWRNFFIGTTILFALALLIACV